MRAALWAVVVAFGLGGVAAANPAELYLTNRHDTIRDRETSRFAPNLLEKYVIYNASLKVLTLSIWRAVEDHCSNIKLNPKHFVDQSRIKSFDKSHQASVDAHRRSTLSDDIAGAAVFPTVLRVKLGTKQFYLLGHVTAERSLYDLSMRYCPDRRSSAHIFHAKYYRYANVHRADYNIAGYFGFDQNPRPLIGEMSVTRGPVRLFCLTGGFGGHEGSVDAQYKGEDQGCELETTEPEITPGYLIRLANGFDCAPLGAQVGVFAVFGFTAIGSIAAGLAWILVSKRRRFLGLCLVGLGLAAWIGAYVIALWFSYGSLRGQESDNRSDDAPMASMAAIKNHAENAPRLIFTAIAPSVSGIPASVNRFAERQALRLGK